ncbi:unnamed protein product [Leptosia nina]|uniref:Uncharacterized protein n=1 Tax=Leptosia nina TaxID=320188 RepID=A0AAV1JWV4_9NEOP
MCCNPVLYHCPTPLYEPHVPLCTSLLPFCKLLLPTHALGSQAYRLENYRPRRAASLVPTATPNRPTLID